jgi:tetratricopeptide (TPR) repeat protein
VPGGAHRRGEPGLAGRAPRLAVPDDVTGDQLDPEARAELRTLPGDLADAVARLLVAASGEPDPERAFEYSLQARKLAARVGVVRETAGVAAYRAGRWAEALAELRTARRLTGRVSYLPLMADSERALGRLDRALAIVHDRDVAGLDRATQIELLIVESGIRRDQGRPAAGAAILRVPELTDGRRRPGSARLFYAYADALLDDGRGEEAREWFGRAAALDPEEDTDAGERYEDLDRVVIDDLAEPESEPESESGQSEVAEPESESGQTNVAEPESGPGQTNVAEPESGPGQDTAAEDDDG